jgi:hypothetical protein
MAEGRIAAPICVGRREQDAMLLAGAGPRGGRARSRECWAARAGAKHWQRQSEWGTARAARGLGGPPAAARRSAGRAPHAGGVRRRAPVAPSPSARRV